MLQGSPQDTSFTVPREKAVNISGITPYTMIRCMPLNGCYELVHWLLWASTFVAVTFSCLLGITVKIESIM